MERRIGSPNEDSDSAVTCKPTPRDETNTVPAQRELQRAKAAGPSVAGGQCR